MKIATSIAGGLLGFLFIAFSLMVLLHLAPQPKQTDPDVIAFMTAFGPTGYMTMVKIFELVGGILVAIPKTRNFGLLVLGPIILNILAFHIFVAKGVGLNPVHAVIVALALFLLWAERKAFLSLLH